MKTCCLIWRLLAENCLNFGWGYCCFWKYLNLFHQIAENYLSMPENTKTLEENIIYSGKKRARLGRWVWGSSRFSVFFQDGILRWFQQVISNLKSLRTMLSSTCTYYPIPLATIKPYPLATPFPTTNPFCIYFCYIFGVFQHLTAIFGHYVLFGLSSDPFQLLIVENQPLLILNILHLNYIKS